MNLRNRLPFLLYASKYQDLIVEGADKLDLQDALKDWLYYVNAYGKSVQSNVPYDYRELEYIESTGTQYIDTGVVPTLDYEFEIKAIKTVNRSLIGSGSDDYVLTGGNGLNYLYQGASQTLLPSTIDNTLVHTWAVKNGYLYCDSDSVAITSTPVTPTNSFALFARKTGSTTFDNIGAHTIYYAKIWNESGILVFNGIPCINPIGQIGIYDTVTQQFFSNIGTGEFIAGPEIVTSLPSPCVRIDYVDMQAGSYAITNIIPKSDYNIEIDFKTTTVQSQNTCYFGTRSSTSSGSGISAAHTNTGEYVFDVFGQRFSPTETFANNTRYLYSYNNGTVSLSSGGSVLYTNTTTPADIVTHPFIINALNNMGTVYGNYEGIYLYSFKVRDNTGKLIADYVPARINALTILYDRVTNQIIMQDSGTWGPGPDTTITYIPTPDNPIDIWCNNGALRARHASGLPLGYTLLDYIESSGTQYIDTGITNHSTKWEITAQRTDTSIATESLVMGYATSAGTYISAKASGWNFSSQASSGDIFSKTDLIYNNTNTPATLTVNGTQIDSYTPATNTRNIYLFATAGASVAEYLFVGRVYSAKITDANGAVIQNLIPCKNASDVVGMYDTVSGQFFTNAGTGDFVAGNTVSDPVEIYTDGTIETLQLVGKNLFDPNSDWDFNTSMTYSAPEMSFPSAASGGTRHTFFFKCQPNTTYTISASTYGDRLWVGGLNNIVDPASYTSENPVSFDTIFARLNSASEPVTFTTGADTKLVGVYYSLNTLPTNLQIEQGSTATTYQPYTGDTATCEDLLSIGDYTDVQEILAGDVTRKVGIKILDGTEDWTKNSAGIFSGQDIINGISKKDGYCTHFKKVEDATSFGDMTVGTYKLHSSNGRALYFNYDTSATTSDWTTYLADQYAAGTPVIIVYPLATETTSIISEQPLRLENGNNVLQITEASLNDLKLEAKYRKRK